MNFKLFKTLFFSTLLLTLTNCKSQQHWKQVTSLAGTWKVENKSTHECWELKDPQTLTGKSYKVIDGQEKVLETLKIEKKGKAIIYYATVPTQNKGATIPFTLNTVVKDRLSFENAKHDFPKKVQYSKVNDQKWQVNILGDDEKGFSLNLIKQE